MWDLRGRLVEKYIQTRNGDDKFPVTYTPVEGTDSDTTVSRTLGD